ncbi:MAG: 1-deoxy-D-xylulose-5-phosphate synthase [Chlamydiales bacterium]
MVEKFLDRIQSPSDIKGLSYYQLKALAQEIRERIIEVMSVNGGHLASNLGAVELTLALHYAFDSPSDKMIWDVSHQTYTHKLLTGRCEAFGTIRQHKGLCGFSHPGESEHDHFHAGHAGTALSLALGVAHNRDLSKRSEYVLPIIGDATLTCGLTLEALNNINKEMKKFIVILNDNRMSISKNVGAITSILSRMINNPTIAKLHRDIDAVLSKIPSYGAILAQQGRKVAESIKNLVSPGAFFEQFGLTYIGPIDGHDVHKLIEVFSRLKNSSWPVLVHVITNKGQGMDVAIKNPTSWHGAKPFDPNTCKFLPTASNKPTFPKVFGNHLLKMAENDPSLVAITPAMSAGSCLDAFMKKFPERCLDVGIAESHSVTFAGGMAYGKKMKVVVSIYSTFLHRALDNLFHDVCLQELPVIFAIDRAGISGPDGATHHGIYDLSFLNAMPNMVIAQPRDGHVLKELMESSFSYGMPTAIRYPNMATETSERPIMKRELGKAEILAEGEGLLILSLGHMNQVALKVREQLVEEGIHPTIVDPVFVKPLDSDLICDLLFSHDKIVTIEEHSVTCGLGAVLNHFLLRQGYSHIQVLNIGIPETFVEHGSHGKLSEELGLTPDKITRSIIRHFSSFKMSPSSTIKSS